MKRHGEMIGDQARVEQIASHRARILRMLVCIACMLVSAPGRGSVTQTPGCDDIEAAPRIAWWPFSNPRRPPLYESTPGNVTPHPAVARIIVPEDGATAFGSGTLVDVREQYGLVVTNWHVVRDSQGIVEVVFPSGFRSHARPLKVDSNWDLAALVIWRPPIEPVKITSQPPRPGDLLTIHGYGRGQYRIATGRCTAYYAPHRNFPMEMVELDVEARQGDSGGPILNQRGEIAGVLFGAAQGTTLGSFAPRVSNFLASLAPDIGQVKDQAQVAVADRPAPNVQPLDDEYRNGSVDKYPSAPWPPQQKPDSGKPRPEQRSIQLAANDAKPQEGVAEGDAHGWNSVADDRWYDRTKSGLAIVGLLAIGLRMVKCVT
jgi:S1-C subfamily serine protease